jgi:hypothetical protein
VSVDVDNICRTVAFFHIVHEFIRDQIIHSGPLSFSKRTDVYEDPVTPTVRSNEAEASIVLPVCDSTLISHADVVCFDCLTAPLQGRAACSASPASRCWAARIEINAHLLGI